MIKKLTTLSILLFTLPNSAAFFFSNKPNLQQLLAQASQETQEKFQDLEDKRNTHLMLFKNALAEKNVYEINFHAKKASEAGLQAVDLITQLQRKQIAKNESSNLSE